MERMLHCSRTWVAFVLGSQACTALGYAPTPYSPREKGQGVVPPPGTAIQRTGKGQIRLVAPPHPWMCRSFIVLKTIHSVLPP
jgi:hypothetical protein